MIGSLRGTVREIHPSFVLLEVGGVGYSVSVALPTLDALGAGQDAMLYIYDHVREDVRDLFGFLSYDELDFFKKLLNVPGVGPKAALSMLSAGPFRDVQGAIMSGDLARLTSVPGVGMKTAQKVVLELKGKLVGEQTVSQPEREIMDALVSLGYSAVQARDALAHAGGESGDTSERVRRALKYLAP
ncbi:Holliday junction branch migration protein RuvA [Candidatus Uhrbacteria bacterium]|nr:Holliday junction branch migration protein RuvA [Candidatus Uhrbacteria bacterium]